MTSVGTENSRLTFTRASKVTKPSFLGGDRISCICYHKQDYHTDIKNLFAIATSLCEIALWYSRSVLLMQMKEVIFMSNVSNTNSWKFSRRRRLDTFYKRYVQSQPGYIKKKSAAPRETPKWNMSTHETSVAWSQERSKLKLIIKINWKWSET